MLEPAALPAEQTVKVPGPVNVCTLKFVSTVDIVPPDAVINCAVGASSCKPESVTNHPFVASTKTKVTAIPSIDKVASVAAPPILEPFLPNVQLFVSNVFA